MAAYQVEHLALDDQVVKRVHDLFNGGGPVPPVHIQDVDVRCAQLLEGGFNGDSEGLGVISGVVHFVGDLILASLKIGRILMKRSVHLRACNAAKV